MHPPGRTENLNAVPCFSDLRDAYAQPGCAFCRLLARTANRYLNIVLWEMVLDPELRSELNEARGYGSEQGWLLVRTGSALGVAILMQEGPSLQGRAIWVRKGFVASAPGPIWVRGRFLVPANGVLATCR